MSSGCIVYCPLDVIIFDISILINYPEYRDIKVELLVFIQDRLFRTEPVSNTNLHLSDIVRAYTATIVHSVDYKY